MASGISKDKATALAKHLSEIAMKTDLEALAVVTREGVRLAFKVVGSKQVDPDLMSAISAAMLHVGESAVEKMGLKELWEVIITGEEGYIVLSGAGKLVLIGAGSSLKTLTTTVSVFRSYSRRIADLFPLND
ncbi:MAG: roadblock/LC7 domain-containing protein [Candidatus Odinarchaeum yellowstonii]|uniref:Roadblock/LC7 domain-containing protein n=1 Tax=Odinarchaeota yellowstonii (strain LCB_4) TaxID=1841599 RepID=A0AAF0IBE7_ODILC|nr:MAG: roadblock/LC7 domain-containing protein [Candidatus Odinarchaeum yellowstonii]